VKKVSTMAEIYAKKHRERFEDTAKFQKGEMTAKRFVEKENARKSKKEKGIQTTAEIYALKKAKSSETGGNKWKSKKEEVPTTPTE
jgi:hypothetical protein